MAQLRIQFQALVFDYQLYTLIFWKQYPDFASNRFALNYS